MRAYLRWMSVAWRRRMRHTGAVGRPCRSSIRGFGGGRHLGWPRWRHIDSDGRLVTQASEGVARSGLACVALNFALGDGIGPLQHDRRSCDLLRTAVRDGGDWHDVLGPAKVDFGCRAQIAMCPPTLATLRLAWTEAEDVRVERTRKVARGRVRRRWRRDVVKVSGKLPPPHIGVPSWRAWFSCGPRFTDHVNRR
eukprot:scaffold246887_cov32-Tisochrysis_lutea.AAC.1